MAGLFGGLGALGGSTLGEVLVRVGVDIKPLEAGLAKAEVDSKAAGAEVSKFATAAKVGFALAAVAAVKLGVEAVKAASEHEHALAELSLAIENNTKITGLNTQMLEDQAHALSDLSGFTDTQILQADQVLARYKLTGDQLQQLIAVSVDYARFTGIELTDAAGKVGKALLGQGRAMKAVGVAYKDAGTLAGNFDQIMGKLAPKVAGASEAFGETFAGRIAKLQAAFDRFMVDLGNAIIPLLESVITDLQGVAHEAENLINLLPGMKPSADEAEAGVSGLQKASFGLAFGFHALTHPLSTLIHGFSIEIPDGTDAASDGLKTAAQAAFDNAQALRESAQAAKDLKAAEKALAGGVVGLIGSVDQLQAAQRDLTAVRKDSKATASDLRTAELGVLNAQLGVTGSMKELIEKQVDAGASSRDIIDKFDAMAQKAGLSKSEIQGLTSFIQAYIDKLKQIPASVNTEVTVNRNLVATGGVTHPRPSPHPTPPPIRGGSGVTVNIISPTDPAQSIVNNLGAWQRQNRDWVG